VGSVADPVRAPGLLGYARWERMEVFGMAENQVSPQKKTCSSWLRELLASFKVKAGFGQASPDLISAHAQRESYGGST
jgi:hypothetical protein